MIEQDIKKFLSHFHIVTYYPVFMLDKQCNIISSPDYFFQVPTDFFIPILQTLVFGDEKIKLVLKETEFYCVFPVSLGETQYILIGPLLYHKPYYQSEIYENQFLKMLGVTLLSREVLERIPHLTYRFFSFLEMFYCMTTQEEITHNEISDLFGQELAKHEQYTSYYAGTNIEQKMTPLLYPYHLEKKMLHHIIRGEDSDAKIIGNDIIKKGKVAVYSVEHSSLSKYSLVSIVSIIRNAVVDAGVDIDSAYTMADYFVGRIDACRTKQEILEAYMSTIEEFSNLCKKRRFHHFPSWVRKSISFIIANTHESITLKEIANHVGLTPAYLSVQFKKITGLSIKQFIHQEKLVEAKHLLASSSLTILDISVLLGYTTQAYFSSVFKKETKLSPSEYRLQCKQY